MTEIVHNNGGMVTPRTATVALAVAAQHGLKVHSVRMHQTQVMCWETNGLTLSRTLLSTTLSDEEMARVRRMTADRDITFCGFPINRDDSMAEDEIEFLDIGKNAMLRIVGLGKPMAYEHA